MIVAFGVRVTYVAVAKKGPCTVRVASGEVFSSPSECTLGDQIFYNAEANSVARGHGFTEPFWSVTHPGQSAPPAADHPPLTVFVLAPVTWLVDHPPLSWIIDEKLNDRVREHRYAMVVLGTLLVFLVGLLGRRVGGDTVGLLAAGIAALSPNIWVNDGLVMSETVTGLTVVGAMLCALWVWRRPTLRRVALLALLCGLAALARAELILFIPLLLVVTVLRVRRPWGERGILACAGIFLALGVIAPWVAYNLGRFREPTFISTNDGVALLGSNCDTAYYGRTIGLTSIAPGPIDCLPDPQPPGDQSEVERLYRKKAFEYIGNHKTRLPLVIAARIGRTWSLYRPDDMVWFNEGEGREQWVTRLGLASYYPTLLAAIAGAIVLWRSRRRFELWVLCVPAISVTIGVAVTYGQTRFRAAAEPSLAVLAAVALVGLVRWATGNAHREDAAMSAVNDTAGVPARPQPDREP